MNKEHPIKIIAKKNKTDNSTGICSVCSSNEFVIEAAVSRAKELGLPVLLESTSNQVNQYGGYTGMTPAQFCSFVHTTAARVDAERNDIVIGGDHLGPNPWKEEPAAPAMQKAGRLIRDCVAAGYSKIHIDTCMRLGDDVDAPSPRLIASRGAELCLEAEKTYAEIRNKHTSTARPVYVIGSEVPIPGGSEKDENDVSVTKAEDFEESMDIYREEFLKAGLSEAWDNVVAFVVQPGVEFGNDSIHPYSRKDAETLVRVLKKYHVVFEGHSTDYQHPNHLRQMVEDGICILKVGPALTFSMREGLFMLECMENELYSQEKGRRLSCFMKVLETTMLAEPKHWGKYYPNDGLGKHLAIKYSYSDRCRYYMDLPAIRDSIGLLLQNLDRVDIPDTLISQYMPLQYKSLREGRIDKTPRSLLIDKIRVPIDDYYYATGAFKEGDL